MPTAVNYAATNSSGASVTRSLLRPRSMTNTGTQQTLIRKIPKALKYMAVEYPHINAGVSQSPPEIFCCTQARKTRVVAISPFFLACWIN